MSLSRDQVMQLMAYADGELDDAERARIAALLASNDEARCVVAAMEGSAVGQWLVDAEEARAAAAGADTIADSVMAAIEREATRPAAAPVIDIAHARAKQPAQRRVGLVVGGILAVAAAVAVYVATQKPSGTDLPQLPVATNPNAEAPKVQAPQAPGPPTAAAPPPAAVAASQPPPVDIDSESNDVSVFYVPSPAAAANMNASSVVIWIGDEPPPRGK